MKYQRVTTPANATGGDGYVGADRDENDKAILRRGIIVSVMGMSTCKCGHEAPLNP